MSSEKTSGITPSVSTTPIGIKKKANATPVHPCGQKCHKKWPNRIRTEVSCPRNTGIVPRGLVIRRTTLVGELLVLHQMERKLGIQRLLTKAFDKATAQQILALAFYSLCTGEPLSYAGVWLEQRGFGSLELEAPRISDLLPSLTVDKQRGFFSSWLTTQAVAQGSYSPETGSTLCECCRVYPFGRWQDHAAIAHGLPSLDDGTRAWLHIYYDSTIRAQAEQEFMALYKTCFDEFSQGNLDPAHQDFYDEYFTRGYMTKNGQRK